jgi:hypothetical protein
MIWGILQVEKGAFTRENKLLAIFFFFKIAEELSYKPILSN